MKLDCNVINDLYPLYKDAVCSVESKVLVEEHLSECKKCREYFENEDIEIQSANIEVDEKRQLAELAKKWKKLLKIRAIRATIKTIVVIGVIFLILDVATAGRTRNAEINIGETEKFSEKEMDQALDAIMDFFHDKRRSILISLEYDEEFSKTQRADASREINSVGGNWDKEKYMIVSTEYTDADGYLVSCWKIVVYYDYSKEEWVVLDLGAG